jgi:hypothetical protein
MIINDVVNLAKYSELSGVAAKNNDDAIVAFINLGMIELYTRFPIRVKEHIITLLDETTLYDMPDDVSYPLKAYGEVPLTNNSEFETLELGINAVDEPLGIFFTDWKTVQIPVSVLGGYVSILYVSTPASITKVQALDGVTSIDLPDSLIDCLLSYIGYRGHLGVKSDLRSESNAHFKRFERNCEKAVNVGVAFPVEEMSMSNRVFTKGFL